MTNAESDEQFVDDMLRQAQHVLGNDPRIHFAHVRHAGARPAESSSDIPPRQSEDLRSAWSQTLALAALLRDLWEHAWLPDPPTDAAVRFFGDGQQVRVEVSSRGASAGGASLDITRDRLIVRGYIAESTTEGGFIATSGGDTIAVRVTGGEIAMTLSSTLDTTDATLDMLSALPAHVKTKTNERGE